MKFRTAILCALVAGRITAEPLALAPDIIVENFCNAMRGQERTLAGATMDVDIEASLPKLKKHGKLHALRRISSLGRITYEMLRFEGDGTVKNNVIARYLTAEAQAQNPSETPSLAVTPENYKFKYKSTIERAGRTVHVFQVAPRTKRVGLFRGDVWIDAATYLKVQESGYFVKSPSVFLKRVAFVRTYEIRDGVSVPRQMQSTMDTRIVGKAELNIEYSNFSFDGQRRSSGDADGQ